jgi:hypothetical protein
MVTNMAASVINQTYIHPFSDNTIQTLYSLSLHLKCVLASQLTFIELYELIWLACNNCNLACILNIYHQTMVCAASVYIDVPVPCANDEVCSAWRQNKRYTMDKWSDLLLNTIPTWQTLFHSCQSTIPTEGNRTYNFLPTLPIHIWLPLTCPY